MKEKAGPAADQVAGDMEQAAQNISEQAVPAARRVGEEVEDGAQRLKKNAGPAADDAVAGARKARAPQYKPKPFTLNQYIGRLLSPFGVLLQPRRGSAPHLKQNAVWQWTRVLHWACKVSALHTLPVSCSCNGLRMGNLGPATEMLDVFCVDNACLSV